MDRRPESLFFCGMIRWGNQLLLSRWNVHVFSRLGVAELLARFLLNGCLIALESLNLLCIALILPLHLIDLLAKRLVLSAFLLVNHHAIGAKHHVHEQRYRQQCHRHGGDPPAQGIHEHQGGTRNLDPRTGDALRLGRALDHSAQAVLWPRTPGNPEQALPLKSFIRKSNSWRRWSASPVPWRCAPPCTRARQVPCRKGGSRPRNRR